MNIIHLPVMKNEILDILKPDRAGSLMVDCTLGEGGHSFAFLDQYQDLKLVCLDADSSIMDIAKRRLSVFGVRATFYNTWYNSFFANYPAELERPDIILFDLGISVFHYKASGRGFSFSRDEKLDMRLNSNLEISAYDIVNSYPEEDLANLIYLYGEERYSRRIASAIVNARKLEPIEMSAKLADIIYHSVPHAYRNGYIHPATRSFQALRIAVNGELERVKSALEDAYSVLKPSGKIGVITFHSLEDRIVKHFFKDIEAKVKVNKNKYAKVPETQQPYIEIITKKPLLATDQECRDNPPSRSAKFRAAIKVRELDI
ncbi:MAG: 16S rRNA (cytosine(1402)-N(4))-methyltransferase RsmH [Spirochaetales bacterium]|nr:16S rRNA (cytosine(1402)-N(4))-methyltransferase RsmH [Spirochaetales bacterium]